MEIVFGPIISRRFGRSLGVDLSPYVKQCNFDCVYCELSYAKKVDKYEKILPLDELIECVKNAISKHQNIDVLTMTANGEPTLYPYLGDFMKAIKPYIPQNIKTLILSNGSLFGESNVQEALRLFDIVKFSLDSIEDSSFKKVDRPHSSIKLETLLQGIRSFAESRNLSQMLVCEILIVKDINDDKSTLVKLAEFLREIGVDRVDLSTIDRPPAYDVKALDSSELQKISKLFDGLFVTLPQRKDSKIIESMNINEDSLLQLIKRRPLSVNEAKNILNEQSMKILQKLLAESRLKIKTVGLIEFYTT